MIKFTDTIVLACTKLRARKVRTIVTVTLASLLFGVLVAVSLLTTGAFKSITDFREDGLTSRYIVAVFSSGNEAGSTGEMRRDPELITEAKARYEALIDEKTAEAERLEIPYHQASDQPPYTMSADGEDEVLQFSDPNGIVADLMEEKYEHLFTLDDQELQVTAQQYGAIDHFTQADYRVATGATLDVFTDGEEVFYDESDMEMLEENYTPPIIEAHGMSIVPEEMSAPFMFADAQWQANDGSIPIILPQDAIERLLQKEAPSSNVPASERMAYLTELRQAAQSYTLHACYRNQASNHLIQQTILQQKEIAANQINDEYEAPKLRYELPDPTQCENPAIASDTRTDEEKEHDARQNEFDEKFNAKTEPESNFVAFTIVGMSPPRAAVEMPGEEERAMSTEDIVRDIFATSGIQQAIPQQLYDQFSAEQKAAHANLFTFEPNYFVQGFGAEKEKHYIEFASATDAQRFIDEQSCTVNVYGNCTPEDRKYNAAFVFSNSVAIDDLQEIATKWFTYAMLGVIILAAIIMWITVGRSIADGRHETAVFRAIGFKRGDIASVYICYTVLLSVLVAIFAGVIGVASAYVVQQQFAPHLTAQAQFAFGGLDLGKEVNLIGVDQQQLLYILAACLLTGLLSMILPLLANVRRSPIKDMREE